MLKSNVCLVLLLLFTVSHHVFSQKTYNELFEAANKLYDEGNYLKAFEHYDSIEKSGNQSPELFLNKGNAAYKLENYPEAIYCYEKALKLNPNLIDATHNLTIVNSKLADKPSKTNQKGVLPWLVGLTGTNYTLFAWLAISFIVILSTLIILNSITTITFLKKGMPIITGLLIVGIIFTLFIGYFQKKQLTTIDTAIVYVPVVDVMNEPSINSSIAFNLHEGSKVQIIEKTDAWVKIDFDTKIGWVSVSALKEI